MIFGRVGICPASPAVFFPLAWLTFPPQGGEIGGEGVSLCSLSPFLSLQKGMERKGRLHFPHPLGERTCQGAVVSLTAPSWILSDHLGFSEVLNWVSLGGTKRDAD